MLIFKSREGRARSIGEKRVEEVFNDKFLKNS